MFGRTARIGAALAGLWLGGCLAGGGGGGGGDCRDGDEACSAGFACVAVANGTAYACRAACDGPDDCLRDEVCGADGVCVDRPPRVPTADAESELTPADVGVTPDADRPIRLIDAEPPADADVVVITPPGACEADRAPASPLLLGVQIAGFEDFPVFFEATSSAEGGRTALSVQPLTNRDRRPTGLVFVSEPFVLDGGAFETPEMEILVPPGANQLGGELRLRVAFVGAVRGNGTICGVLEGQMIQPPVGDIDGSIFAGRSLGDRLGSPFGACDGCLP